MTFPFLSPFHFSALDAWDQANAAREDHVPEQTSWDDEYDTQYAGREISHEFDESGHSNSAALPDVNAENSLFDRNAKFDYDAAFKAASSKIEDADEPLEGL